INIDVDEEPFTDRSKSKIIQKSKKDPVNERPIGNVNFKEVLNFFKEKSLPLSTSYKRNNPLKISKGASTCFLILITTAPHAFKDKLFEIENLEFVNSYQVIDSAPVQN